VFSSQKYLQEIEKCWELGFLRYSSWRWLVAASQPFLTPMV
jgi:hypothetical protein